MKKHRLKNYLRLGILLFGISVFVIACQQDDFESNEDVQVLIPKGKSYAKINTGNNVSESAVDFLKEKTNNTLGVIIGTDNVRLSINDVAYRTSPLGTVDTSKEVVVINETNTKHTFKVDNPNDDSNTVTNIIVVENESETYEYFLKYNFDGGIPYNANGTVDLSRFTGTIDAYDSDGQRTGGISISNGEVIDNDGQTTPCPDDNTTPPDDGDDNDNQTGGGAQGEVGDGSPDSGDNGGTNDDQGGGGWFDGGPDWNPCTISYHRECSNGYSGEHEPTEINTAGDLCSGTLNGAGVLVVTDCNGTVLGSGRYMNRTGEQETLNPCGGTTGVLLDNDTQEECDKITDFFSNNSTMQGALNTLANATLTEPNEIALTLQTDGTPTLLNESPEGETSVAIPYNPPNSYNMVSHIHIENDTTKTMSVFSFEDIIGFGKMCNNNKLDDDMVFFLSTGKGTHFAMTLTDTSKLCDFAYGKDVSLEELATMDTNQAIQSRLLREKVYDKYYNINNSNVPIRTDNFDNEEVLEAFMEFISEAHLGIQVFETDENFQNFSPLELENDQVKRVIKKIK
jgi:hypothetical protein